MKDKPTHAAPATADHEGFALDDLFSVEALVSAYPDKLTVATLRWQLRHRDTNGLASAVVTLGKKLHLHKPRYERWLATRAGLPA